MNTNAAYPRIITDESLRETISHGNEDFPFSYYLEDIWKFDFHCIDWHWHPEVEFIYIQKGTVTFLIGSERFNLQQGSGLFINTQILHRFEASESAIIPNIVFSPVLLAPEQSLIYRKYIQPVLTSVNYQIYTPDIPWQGELLQILSSIFEYQDSEYESELETVQLLLQLWNILYRHTPIPVNSSCNQTYVRTQARLQIMMQYIHQNYHLSITLDDLARISMLSKSSVLNLFNNYLHTSPIRYLVDYRLKQAARLLLLTDNSISFIAQNTGFENAGYFCRKFKELFQMTPGEYRKQNNKIHTPIL